MKSHPLSIQPSKTQHQIISYNACRFQELLFLLTYTAFHPRAQALFFARQIIISTGTPLSIRNSTFRALLKALRKTPLKHTGIFCMEREKERAFIGLHRGEILVDYIEKKSAPSRLQEDFLLKLFHQKLEEKECIINFKDLSLTQVAAPPLPQGNKYIKRLIGASLLLTFLALCFMCAHKKREAALPFPSHLPVKKTSGDRPKAAIKIETY